MGTRLLVAGQAAPASAEPWAPGGPQGHPCIPGATPPKKPQNPVPRGEEGGGKKVPLTWRDAPVTAEMSGRRARGGTAPGAAGGASARRRAEGRPPCAVGPGPSALTGRMAATAFRRRRRCGYGRRGADLRPPRAGGGGERRGPPAAGSCAPRIPRGPP